MHGFWQTLQRQFHGQERLAQLLVNLFWAAIAILIAVLVVRIARKVVRRVLLRAHVPANVVELAGNGVTLVTVTITVAVLLSDFGVPPTAVVTAFSLATAGIVFAFQDLLKNLIAGIYLLVEHPFTIGDHIRVRDVEGVVQTVNVRTTALNTNDGTIVMVPNNIIFTEIVHNRTVSGIVHTALTLANVQGGPDTIIPQALAALTELELLPVPAPRAQFLSMKDGAAEVQVEFWYSHTYPDLTLRAIGLLRTAFPDATISTIKAA